MISSYRIAGGKVYVTTPYCEDVIKTCRSWAGKFEGGEWVLPLSRLPEVEEYLGRNTDDQVEVRVSSWHGYAQIRVGWYVLAGRAGRDRRADVYAELEAGTIPSSGGSVKNPAVSPSEGCVFRLWVPRDFALARSLQIVTDPKATAESALPPSPLVIASDADLLAECQRRGLVCDLAFPPTRI